MRDMILLKLYFNTLDQSAENISQLNKHITLIKRINLGGNLNRVQIPGLLHTRCLAPRKLVNPSMLLVSFPKWT